jgi:hypothetical protein
MRSHGMSPNHNLSWGTRPEGDSQGHGGCRSSFLEPPARSFSPRARPQSEQARGSCRSRGRQERAHRSLENRQTGFPQLPPALSSFLV